MTDDSARQLAGMTADAVTGTTTGASTAGTAKSGAGGEARRIVDAANPAPTPTKSKTASNAH